MKNPSLCIRCKKDKSKCISVCDMCNTGLCDKCSKSFEELTSSLVADKIKCCNVCKTDFYQFCDFCHNQTIDNMVRKKILNLTDKRTLLSDRNKKWSNLSDELKALLGDPNDFPNHCDCDDPNHCRNLAKLEVKEYWGMSDFSLYELRSAIICKKCYIKKYGKEPEFYPIY